LLFYEYINLILGSQASHILLLRNCYVVYVIVKLSTPLKAKVSVDPLPVPLNVELALVIPFIAISKPLLKPAVTVILLMSSAGILPHDKELGREKPPLDPPLDPPDAPLDPPNDAPLDPPNDAPLDPPNDAPLDPPDVPLDPPNDAPLDPPNDAPLDPPNDPPLDAPLCPPLCPPDPPLNSPLDPVTIVNTCVPRHSSPLSVYVPLLNICDPTAGFSLPAIFLMALFAFGPILVINSIATPDILVTSAIYLFLILNMVYSSTHVPSGLKVIVL